MRRVSMVVVILSSLACAGVDPKSPVAPEPVSDDAPCCSVDDVAEMTTEGVEPGIIIDALYASGTNLALSSDDLVKLSTAGVAREVIDVLQGGPYECKPLPRPAPRPAPTGSPSPAPSLNVTVKYGGGRSFELVNLSTNEYTGLTLVANKEYQYRLKKLPAGSSDSIRLVSFVSRTDGKELRDTMTQLSISADQGSWWKSF